MRSLNSLMIAPSMVETLAASERRAQLLGYMVGEIMELKLSSHETIIVTVKNVIWL